MCETGGGRRSWLRGTVNVTKAHVLRCAAYNLGLLLRKVFGLGKPRSGAVLFALIGWLQGVMDILGRVVKPAWEPLARRTTSKSQFRDLRSIEAPHHESPSSLTGC